MRVGVGGAAAGAASESKTRWLVTESLEPICVDELDFTEEGASSPVLPVLVDCSRDFWADKYWCSNLAFWEGLKPSKITARLGKLATKSSSTFRKRGCSGGRSMSNSARFIRAGVSRSLGMEIWSP